MPRQVVLLHGWGGSFATTWADTGWVDRLEATGRKVCPVDLPGHCPGDSLNPADYNDLAGALVERLPAEEVDIIAFSLGAKLALAICQRRLAKIGRLILGGLGDNAFEPEPAAEMLAKALSTGIEGNTPRVIAELVRYAAKSGADPDALAAVLLRPKNPVLDDEQDDSIPATLLVNSNSDAIAMPDGRLRHKLGNPAYVLLEGVGHLQLTANRHFQDAAADFLGRGTASIPLDESTEDRQ